MTIRIEQREKSDCMICTTAMALGITYEEIAERLGPAFMTMVAKYGISDEAEPALLSTLGLRIDVDFKRLTISPHWSSIQFVRNILWGRRALICVRSRNNRDGQHSVYWDGSALFDPSPLDRYDHIGEVEPIELIIFQERPR